MPLHDLLAVGLGDPSDAGWDACRGAAASDAADPAEWVTTAALLLTGGRADRAAELLNQANDRWPDDVGIRLLLARALRLCGRSERAVECLASHMETHAGDPCVGRELTLALIESGRGEQAARLAKTLLESFPTRKTFVYLYGAALECQGLDEPAARCYASAAERRSDDAHCRLRLGRCLFRLGRYADAVAALDRAIELAPHLLESHFYLGRTLAALDDSGRARWHLMRFLSDAPRDALRAEAVRILEGGVPMASNQTGLSGRGER